MKRLIATLVLVAALLLPNLVFAQVFGETGIVGYGLNKYGRVRLFVPNSSGDYEIDRASILAALDSANVFDYEFDAAAVTGPDNVTGGIADAMATVFIDNTYSGTPPNVQVRETVYAWNNDSYLMVQYTLINYSSGSYILYLGIGCVPEPSSLYGGETVGYDGTKKLAYFFRTGEAPYLGVKVLGASPYSFHVLDWDIYSSDPNNDVATDSTRWRMTALPGFDAPLTGGADGTFFNLNVGARTIAAGDSVTFMMAYMYGTGLSELQAVSDSADARYARTFVTSVSPISRTVPENFALLQNYPNPFNPSTAIEFQLSESAQAKLTVHDVLGREVATLVNDHLNAGSYRVNFEAHTLASGYYYYRLVAGSHTATKRMLLVK